MNKTFFILIGIGLSLFAGLPGLAMSQSGAPGVVDEQKPPEAAKVNPMVDELNAVHQDIKDVLRTISLKTGQSIVYDESINGAVTVYLSNADIDDALRIVLDMTSLAYYREGDDIYVVDPEQYRSKYGYSFQDKVKTQVKTLSYAEPEEILKLLSAVKTETGKVLYDQSHRSLIMIDSPQQVKVMMQLIDELDVPRETKSFPLKYKKVGDLEGKVRALLTKNAGTIQTDPAANILTVSDTVSNVKKIGDFIERVDKENETILFDVRVMRIILNDEHEEGVDWEAIVSDYQNLELMAPGNDEIVDRKQSLSIGTLSDEDYQVLLDALDTVGVISTISKSRETTQAQKMVDVNAKLMEVVYNSENRAQQEILENTDEIDLSLTPKIGDDGLITVKIHPQITAIGTGILPSVDVSNKKRFEQQNSVDVTLENGSTIVIGGYFKDTSIESIKKIPLLGDLPLLGVVFRNQGQSVNKTEVVIFITPTIIEE